LVIAKKILNSCERNMALDELNCQPVAILFAPSHRLNKRKTTSKESHFRQSR
jgi:hypothetical protein